jgi:hypothetical protein
MKFASKLAMSAAVLVTTVVVVPGASASEGAVVCPASVTVPAKTSSRFYPPLRSGDGEFEGHGPAITVSAKRQRWDAAQDYLSVVVRMRAEETQSDWTMAEGTQLSFTLYVAPAGCNIDATWLTLGAFDSNGYLAKGSYPNPYSLPAGDSDVVNKSFVSGYTVWDDRVGSDVAAYTSVQVTTRAFTVRFTN